MPVQEATQTATIVQHEPLLSRAWRDGNLRYDVAMNLIIIVLIVAAILHIHSHHIPLDENVIGFKAMIFLSICYPNSFMYSCMAWGGAFGSEDEMSLFEAYFMGRITHTSGFCLFLSLVSLISNLALYIALLGLLWFVPAMIAPCFPQLYRGEPAWWNFVVMQQPHSTVSIV
ncbi:uncharacterized protein LOC17896035 [Capsella rubella]|uniref:uncharacterized protein LOC17896035 n=1 Tax=Capsella rubella TaxID=81985 RepID=UPI000CD4CF78|nr:uncharacterized protein LOC17896035 [Capsella rubella]